MMLQASGCAEEKISATTDRAPAGGRDNCVLCTINDDWARMHRKMLSLEVYSIVGRKK